MYASVNCICNVCGSAHSCGALSMAVLLGQPFEYHTYCITKAQCTRAHAGM